MMVMITPFTAQVVAVLSKILENYNRSIKVVRMVLAFLINVVDQPGSAGIEATRVLAVCGAWLNSMCIDSPCM